MAGTEKRGGEKKILKSGGKLGQMAAALKRRGWYPLTNYGYAIAPFSDRVFITVFILN